MELGTLVDKLMQHAKKYDKTSSRTRPPHFRDWKPTKEDDVPHVWFPPQHSHVLELKGYDVTTSDQFSANVTLRFPRVVKIRYDKEWHECETLDTVQVRACVGAWVRQCVTVIAVGMQTDVRTNAGFHPPSFVCLRVD